MGTYNKKTFATYCNLLCQLHPKIKDLHAKYGAPPYWKRPNKFSSFVKTILEQQVSLAAAHKVYCNLEAMVSTVTPENIAALGSLNLKGAGITRQKTSYILLLAEYFMQHKNYSMQLKKLDQEKLFVELCKHKGVGKWTANVLMLTVFNKLNVYPNFDVALMSGVQMALELKTKPNDETTDLLLKKYEPYKSIAVCYFYWVYINEKKVKFIP